MRPKATRFDKQLSESKVLLPEGKADDKELQSAEPSVGLMPESEVSAHVMSAPADLKAMPESDSAHVMPVPEPIMPSVTLPEGETGDKELQSNEPSVGLMPESDTSAHVMPAPADPEAPVDLMPRESDSAHVMPVHAPDVEAEVKLALDVEAEVKLKNSCIAASLDRLAINKAMDHDGAVLEAAQRCTGTTLNGFYSGRVSWHNDSTATVLLFYCTTTTTTAT